MPEFNLERRNFIKSLLLGIGVLFLKFCGFEKLAEASSPIVAADEIGVVYDTATGMILRTINPGRGEHFHLDWVENNLPVGKTLLRIKKSAVGADEHNSPSVDALMPFINSVPRDITLNN